VARPRRERRVRPTRGATGGEEANDVRRVHAGAALTYEEWLALARADSRIVGVVVTGSRGRNAYVRDESDWDLRVVVRDGEDEFARSLGTPHGSAVEVAASTLDSFRTAPAWDRYSYAHVEIPVDKLDGEIARVVAAKGTLAPAEARDLARERLAAYTNSLYRSLRDAVTGLELAARLDAAESLSSLLPALFALEERVRPFNKYLCWELETHPLREWETSELLELVERSLDGDPDPQRTLFRQVEAQARRHGHGDLVDEWGPQVAFLRGSE
jgi:hypothetical protein